MVISPVSAHGKSTPATATGVHVFCIRWCLEDSGERNGRSLQIYMRSRVLTIALGALTQYAFALWATSYRGNIRCLDQEACHGLCRYGRN